MPSKFYGIAAAGRTTLFIGDTAGEIARLLRAGQCGYSVPVGADAELTTHILALRNNPSQCQLLGRNARDLFNQRFARRIACGHWAALLDEVAGGLPANPPR
ncbi:MAG: hypothetical protein R3F53_10725 [Gammaproteobacteria bacterium]